MCSIGIAGITLVPVDSGMALSRALPAKEILALVGIQSLQFLECGSASWYCPRDNDRIEVLDMDGMRVDKVAFIQKNRPVQADQV